VSGDDFPEVLVLAEAAKLLCCSEATLYKRILCGDVPAVKCGGWRISRRKLMEWVESGMPERDEAASVGAVRGVAGKRGRG
jgi:excisionase family DNA binding protein